MTENIRVNILLPRQMYEDFRDRCEFSGTKMSTVVRSIIANELAEPEFTAKAKPVIDTSYREAQREMAEHRKAEIIARRENGESPTVLAREYGVSVSAISHMVRRAKLGYNG